MADAFEGTVAALSASLRARLEPLGWFVETRTCYRDQLNSAGAALLRREVVFEFTLRYQARATDGSAAGPRVFAVTATLDERNPALTDPGYVACLLESWCVDVNRKFWAALPPA